MPAGIGPFAVDRVCVLVRTSLVGGAHGTAPTPREGMSGAAVTERPRGRYRLLMVTVAGARRARADDSTRERVVLLNQLLLAAMVLFASALVLGFSEVVSLSSLVVGGALAIGATGAAIVVPWNRVPHIVSIILPIVDIVAIALMREAAPSSTVGLLWVFPAMWISSVFGAVAAVLVTVSITAIFWTLVAMTPTQTVSTAVFVLPVVIAALSTIMYLGSRRAAAQRDLLAKQSRHLQQSVDRARRQEDVLTDVLDAVDFGVIRIAPDGTLAVTNEAHVRLQSGRGARQGDSLVYAADGVTVLDPGMVPVARARRGETFENEVVWYGDPGEERRALSVTARVLKDVDESAAGMIVVSRDVTAEELALRAREDLVASVSHELRTPLTSIMGYVEIVLDDESLSASSRRNLEVAERNASRLLELVSDILTVSAASRQGIGLGLDPQLTDLAPVVRAAIEAAEPRAAERGITIDSRGVEETVAYADSHRVRQVVDNLISNAVKYNHDEGHVEVGATSDGLHAWIVVRDDGAGISEQEVPKLFERFFRSDAVRKTTTHGSGLGLAISREIVRAHGGEITVQTRVGEGSTFIVRLPASDPRGEA